MASIINASATGVGGVITTADASGVLQLQSNGTTSVEVTNSTFKFNSGYGSVATAYGCRAWVNFNGTGTVAIRASGNVSSITDLGTAYYRINFTTSMPDVNFSASGCAGSDVGGGNDNGVVTLSNRAVSSLNILTRNVQSSGGAVTDYDAVQVQVFR